MLRRLRIEQYRGFKELEVGPLARVNVLVGPNNAGKTGVLEAAELVARGADPGGIVDILRRREEYSLEPPSGMDRFPYDVRGLFFGRSPDIGAAFSIQGHDGVRTHLRCTLRLLNEDETDRFQGTLPFALPDSKTERIDALDLFDDGLLPLGLELRADGGSPVLMPLAGRFFRRRYEVSQAGMVQFLGTSLASSEGTSALWDEIALTPKEEQVVATLQIIEPLVQRVAVLGGIRRPSVYLQLKGHRQRVPLGSMGDGIKRLFALALSIGNTPQHGTLLVDEIDTGLHHTVMTQMWELILHSAERINFQAFLTTHSLDCLLALSRLLRVKPEYASIVAVHRLERDSLSTVHFGADELNIAIDNELEIR